MKTLLQCKAEIIKEKHPNLDLAEFTSYFQGTDYYDQLMDEAAELFASQFREPSSPNRTTVSIKANEDAIIVNGKRYVKESETREQEELITYIRNSFVAMMPTGELKAWDLIQSNKAFVDWLDGLPELLTRKPLDR